MQQFCTTEMNSHCPDQNWVAMLLRLLLACIPWYLLVQEQFYTSNPLNVTFPTEIGFTTIVVSNIQWWLDKETVPIPNQGSYAWKKCLPGEEDIKPYVTNSQQFWICFSLILHAKAGASYFMKWRVSLVLLAVSLAEALEPVKAIFERRWCNRKGDPEPVLVSHSTSWINHFQLVTLRI